MAYSELILGTQYVKLYNCVPSLLLEATHGLEGVFRQRCFFVCFGFFFYGCFLFGGFGFVFFFSAQLGCTSENYFQCSLLYSLRLLFSSEYNLRARPEQPSRCRMEGDAWVFHYLYQSKLRLTVGLTETKRLVPKICIRLIRLLVPLQCQCLFSSQNKRMNQGPELRFSVQTLVDAETPESLKSSIILRKPNLDLQDLIKCT